ncbi:MAG TPA: LamG domain-containing protein [bacterium]|nr:LamG domain-containing protein [bacterium]
MSNVSNVQLSLMALTGAAALSASMTLGMLGCAGDEFTTAPAGDGGEGGGSVDGGMGGEGGTSVLGTQYIPNGIRPTLGQKLSAMRAHLQWSAPSATPEGKTFDHYDVCWATGTVMDLGGESECPNPATTQKTYSAIASLTAGTQYFWKVRTGYTDGTTSYYSSALPFRTDSSLIAWWPFNGNMNDASGSSHTGSLKNGAAFATGLLEQGVKMDGIDDNVQMDETDPYSFGTNDFAFSLWVRPDASSLFQTFLEKRTSSDGYELYRRPTGKLAFAGAGCGEVLAVDGLVDGAWNHIVVSRSADSVRLYVNSLLAGMAMCADNFNTTAHLTFGCNSPERGCTTPLKGFEDEPAVINRDWDENAVINEYCAVQVLSGAAVPGVCQ